MNKKTITISIFAFAFIGGFLVFYNPKTVSTPPTQNNFDISGTVKEWESKIDDQANITVTVTPTLLGEKSGEWKFDVVIDTHSVEVDQDMTKIVVLVDDQGKEYAPLNWEGPTGGHHREGVLSFNSVESTKSVEIKIKDIAGIPERSFKWSLK